MGYCYKVTIAPTQKEFEDDGYEYEVGLFLNKQTAMGATIDALDEFGFDFGMVQEYEDDGFEFKRVRTIFIEIPNN